MRNHCNNTTKKTEERDKFAGTKIRKLCCIISTCKGEEIDLVHKLPSNKERAIEWLNKINIPTQYKEMSLEKIRNRAFICSKHFRREDYKHSKSRELNKTAVPSLLLDTNESDDDDDDDGNCRSPAKYRNKSNYYNNVTSDFVLNMEPTNYDLSCLRNTNKQINKNIDQQTIQNNKQSIVVDDNMDVDNNTIDILGDRTLKSNKLSSITLPIAAHRSHTPEMFVISSDNNNNNNNNDNIASESDGTIENLIEYVDDYDEDIKSEGAETIDDQDNDNVVNESITVDDECTLKNEVDNSADKQSIATKTTATSFQSPTTKTMITQCTDEDCIQIKCEKISETLTINYIWLRDHCRCNSCYNHSTFQRRTNINTIPLTIRPLSVELDNDNDEEHLIIKWKNDEHLSKYNLLNLYEWLNEFNGNANVKKESLQQVTLWNHMDIQNYKYALVRINDYISDDTVTKAIVKSLIEYGLAFIEGVPATLTSTEIAVKRLFPIQKTLFGDMWSFNDTNTEHSDTAYTKEYLGAHTDNTYFCDAAGLQIFHCIQHTNGRGGESLLIDGFKVLKNFKAKHPQSYDRLCKVNVTAEYIEDGHHHKYCSPIIKLNPITKEPEQIRYNLYDRSPMNTIPQCEMTQFYTDLNLLTQEIESKENEWWFKLNPGTILFFDNWRVLHGRAAYTGRRQMTGCYVSRTDFQSVARTMGIII